jgi:hypothetical protein
MNVMNSSIIIDHSYTPSLSKLGKEGSQIYREKSPIQGKMKGQLEEKQVVLQSRPQVTMDSVDDIDLDQLDKHFNEAIKSNNQKIEEIWQTIEFKQPETPSQVPAFDKKMASSWVKKHDKQYRKYLTVLIKNIMPISHEKFTRDLFSSVELFSKKIKNKFASHTEFFVGVQEGKSNKWVADLAYQKLKETGSTKEFTFTCKVLGPDHASQLVNDIKKIYGEQVKQKSNNSIRINKKLPTNIVLFDDGSYSGKQISEHVQEIFKLHSTLGVKQQQMNIYVVIPYMTTTAKKRLEKVYKHNQHTRVEDFIFTKTTIPTVRDVLIDQQKGNFNAKQVQEFDQYFWPKETKNLHLEGWGSSGRGIYYFAHKIPNAMSFPEHIAKGTIVNNSSEKIEMISKIAEPYKNSSL